jgi:hypothetical protein
MRRFSLLARPCHNYARLDSEAVGPPCRVPEDRIFSMPEAPTDDGALLAALGGIPLGHYYSPYPSPEDIRRAVAAFTAPPIELPGIDLNLPSQLELLRGLGQFSHEISLCREQDPNWRYHGSNVFDYGDASVLWAMLRQLHPRRVLEVGSGFSSAVTLDVNERFFDDQIECVFIDPEPERLLGLLKPGDRVRILSDPVQDVELSTFDALEAGDILFIDSSHVVKGGSDVTHLVFNVLPRLKKGVHVHFHDIFWPFEYPKAWIERDRRAWAETYLLRAFLHNNTSFEIRFFCEYLWRFHRVEVSQVFPAMLEGRPGSFYVRATGINR